MSHTLKIHSLGEVEYSPHILLDPKKKYEIALTHGLIPKSWNNISSALGNNSFVWNSVTYNLEDGHYDLDALIDEMREVTGQTTINLVPRRHNGQLKIVNGTAQTLQITTLASVLGCANPTTILTTASAIGTSPADFSGGIHEVELHCNLVDRRFTRHQGRTSNLINSVVAAAQPHGHIVTHSGYPNFTQMTNAQVISNIKLELKDQLGRDIVLDDSNRCEFVLHIRPCGINP